MRVSLSKIVVSGDNPRENFNEEEIKTLGQNILEHGLIHPILVRPLPDGKYELVVGERRLRAHMAVSLPEIEADIRELTDVETQEIRLIENIHRVDLTDAEKGTAFLNLWQISECETLKALAEKEQIPYNTVKNDWVPASKNLSEKVKQLQSTTGSTFSDKHARFLMKYPHSTQDKLAEVSIKKNLTSRQLQELTKRYDADNKINLEEIANEILGLPKTVTIPVTQLTEEQKQALRKEKENKPKPIQPKHKTRVTKTPKIAGNWSPVIYKPKKVMALYESVKEPKLPEGKFATLVIDPPWPMQKITRDARPNQTEQLDYPTMTIEEIQNKIHEAIKEKAFENCHVYLWTTQKFLPEALAIFEKCGINYECLMTWVKNVGFTPFSWMYDTEHVLFGRIGNLDLLEKGLRLSFIADVTRHSEKPDIFFYERVCKASPAPRLEMFTRKPHEGFKPWGNEVDAIKLSY
jgi:ParB/RepB/Spo0J family partition protein